MAAGVATVVGGDSGGEVVNAFRLTRASSVETPLLLARQVSIQSTRIRGRLAVHARPLRTEMLGCQQLIQAL